MLQLIMTLQPKESVFIEQLSAKGLLSIDAPPKRNFYTARMQQEDFPCLLALLSDTSLLTLEVQQEETNE